MRARCVEPYVRHGLFRVRAEAPWAEKFIMILSQFTGERGGKDEEADIASYATVCLVTFWNAKSVSKWTSIHATPRRLLPQSDKRCVTSSWVKNHDSRRAGMPRRDTSPEF